MMDVAEIAPVLDVLVDGARPVLGERLVGVYLVGSFALGCADEWSDVDVVAAVDISPDEVSRGSLEALHRRLPDHVEVSYAVAADLRSPMTVGRRWWHLDHGARDLELSAHVNTAHTRWVLREHGIVLTGPPPRDLVAEVTSDVLRAEALGSARALAEEVEDDPGRLADAWWQPFLVLTACRVLHTAVHADVVGRREAAGSALRRLDAVHREIVERAVAERPHPRDRGRRSADPALAAPTRALLWDVVRLTGEAALAARS